MSANGLRRIKVLPLKVTAGIIKDHLANIQERRHKLELIEVANGHSRDDVIPGEPPKKDNDGNFVVVDGKATYPTYGEFYDQLDAQETRLMEYAEERPGLVELIEKLVEAEATANAG